MLPTFQFNASGGLHKEFRYEIGRHKEKGKLQLVTFILISVYLCTAEPEIWIIPNINR